MQHTPGPWIVREPEDGELHEIYAENGGDLICYPVFTANQKANIPLIAAAPDLLSALRAALASFRELDSGWRDMDATLVDQIIATNVYAIEGVVSHVEGRTDDK